MTTGQRSPFLSVIVPVLNGASTLGGCLEAVRASSFTDYELIVVDDGSSDASVDIAADAGALLLSTAGRRGPGAARNLGGDHASGEYLFFVDADCTLAPGAMELAAGILRGSPDLTALFGSYDDSPSAPGLVARYKNLQHHHVHQTGFPEASTFWAACGAIRHSAFESAGGFDPKRHPRASIEDIELGYRLREAGGRIRLERDLQVKHHKAWNLAGVLRSDLVDRGIPWTLLLMERGQVGRDLNLGNRARASVILATLMLAGLMLALIWPRTLLLSAVAGLVLLWLNFGFYRLLLSRGGLTLLAGGILLHWIYQLNCAVAYCVGHFLHWRRVE